MSRGLKRRVECLELEKQPLTFVFWRGGDRISVDGRKLTETEFDKYCDEHLPANAKVIVTGWEIHETVEADGSGTIELERKMSERKKSTV